MGGDGNHKISPSFILVNHDENYLELLKSSETFSIIENASFFDDIGLIGLMIKVVLKLLNISGGQWFH